jgi:outer membrane protein insertion porin family
MDRLLRKTKELFMLKRLNFLIITLICFFPNIVCSVESLKVAVLPFEVKGSKDLSYLSDTISDAVKTHLQKDGAVIADLSMVSDLMETYNSEDIDIIRAIGIKSGADYVVWGKLNWLDDQFSIHADAIEPFKDTVLQSFVVEGGSIENLPIKVKELAGKISLKFFQKEKVAKVSIVGNKRIESDAIQRVISIAPGEMYITKALTQDLKNVYAMGYFEDIRIETEDSPEGKIVIFNVTEKPTIKKISFSGNLVYKDEELLKNIKISVGSILNAFKIRSDITRLEALYKEKHYHNVKITYKVNPIDNNQAELEFIIEEGKKVRIKTISFQGNRAYSVKQIKKTMKTKEKGFFSFLTSAGDMNKDDLSQDASRITAFYHNNGFIMARVSEPQLEFKGNWIYVTIKIDEGSQYKVGKVDIEGDLILPKESLMKMLKISNETFFNRGVLREDVLGLTDLYSNFGYAFADISPRINPEPDKLVVDLTYVVSKGEIVYFEKIFIRGNSKTRDKVIRRELPVYEQGLYSGTLLKRAERNLNRLDYFEDIKFSTSKGSADDKMLLKVDVTEKPTGELSFGGGYSSQESVFAVASITQRNLFGRGQLLSLKAELGARTTSFILNFTEPWLFDIPLSAGINLYNWDRSYDDYDTATKGGGLSISYPVFDYTRVFCSYALDVSEISNFDIDVSDSIFELEGTNVTSSVTTGLRYDSRDKAFNATRGGDHSISFQYAGLGGTVGFGKLELETGWYYPLFWKFVGFLHAKTGVIWKNHGRDLPDYERFYLGGINSLRGFEWDDLSPTEINRFGFVSEVGGNKFVQFNVECLFPLIKNTGFMGVIFFDTGDVYKEGENIQMGNLRKSVGLGVRWYSPMGPLRFEYGHILGPKEGENDGRWEFTMGSAF